MNETGKQALATAVLFMLGILATAILAILIGH